MNDPSRPAQITQAIASSVAATEPSGGASPPGGAPPGPVSSVVPGQPASPEEKTTEAVAVERIDIKAQSPAEPVPPKRASWEQAPNLVLLLFLLYLAVGAVCEISSRNEDYVRVGAHHKWLLSCLNGGNKDKGCPGEDLNSQIEIAVTQVRFYDSLNTVGVGSKCLTAPVIAAPLAGFQQSCLAMTSDPPVEVEPERKALLASILSPASLSFRAAPFRFDELPRDQLYFFLVLVASAIGSLIGGLRVAGITTLKDLTLGLGAGFGVYLLLRSGNFVSLTNSVNVDILNPFSAGAVGMLVGLFSDKAFRLVDGLFGASMSKQPESLEANRITVDKARMTAGSPVP